MKRGTLLTTAFALLGCIVIAGSSQPSSNASNDCTADCQDCMEYNCSHCEINGNTYNLYNNTDCIACWADCGFMCLGEAITNPALCTTCLLGCGLLTCSGCLESLE